MASDRTVDSIVDFATYLQQNLLHQDEPLKNLSMYLEWLPLRYRDLSSSERIKLDKHGVALWNICYRLRQTGQLLARKELLSQARAFAFFILESASEADTGSLKNALKAAKECLDAKLPELALKILERAAVIQETQSSCSAYLTEYLLLRLALAWRQDRIDLAEKFFAKLHMETARPTAADARICILLFHEIGRDYLEKKHSEMAAKWLGRAAVMFEGPGMVGSDAADLRLNVLHTYARSLLSLGNADAAPVRPREILETLQRLYGRDNNAVLLLQFEIASREEPSAYFAEVDVLSQSPLTDSHQKAAMHHIYHLRKYYPRQAGQLLKHYLVERLAVHANEELVESVLITFVCISTWPEYTNETAILEDAFTKVHQVWTKSLSAGAAQGTLVFLWKQIEKSYGKKEYGDAAAWCRLAMHQLLSGRMEDTNAGKIQRKLLQCLLKQSKPGEARDVAMEMSQNVIRHPLSLYLTYCIAIRLNDEDLAHGVLKQAKSDGILFACLSETLRYELDQAREVKKTCSRICKTFKIAADCIRESLSFSLPETDWFTKASFNLALRCYKEWSTQSIIQLLSYAAISFDEYYPESSTSEDGLLVEELRKRHANSLFGLAMLHATEARTAKSAEVRAGKYEDVRQYVHLFGRHLNPFIGHNGRYTTPEPRTSKEVYSPHLAQQITLLPIEFEAGLHVPDKENADNAKYERLSDTITEALKLNAPAKIYGLFADMIFCAVSRDHHSIKPLISVDTAAKLLRQLISATRGTEGYDAQQASWWIRCIVQLAVNTSEQGITSQKISFMEEVVEQVIVLATIGNSRKGKREAQGEDAEILDIELGAVYPAEELEWLATTLFNLAVDCYVGEQEELGKKWARKAVELAGLLAASRGADGNEELLASVLKEKMVELGWSASI